MPKVSVIVTCFNSENVIINCLGFIQDQTIDDIEIICVNDCSSDNTENLIKEIQKHDQRIRIVNHSKNSGLSVSRNTGIINSSSDYITFVDDDDYLKPNFIETLLDTAIEFDADLVSCRNCRLNSNGIGKNSPEIEIFSDEEYFDLLLSSLVPNSSWGRLWKKSIFDNQKNLFFPHLLHEDMDHTYQILYQGIKHIRINYIGYVWNYRESSISNIFTEKYLESFFIIMKRSKDLFYNDRKDLFATRMLGIWSTIINKILKIENISKDKSYISLKYNLINHIDKYPEYSWNSNLIICLAGKNDSILNTNHNLIINLPSDISNYLGHSQSNFNSNKTYNYDPLPHHFTFIFFISKILKKLFNYDLKIRQEATIWYVIIKIFRNFK